MTMDLIIVLSDGSDDDGRRHFEQVQDGIVFSMEMSLMFVYLRHGPFLAQVKFLNIKTLP
jgi:hypothetical protein